MIDILEGKEYAKKEGFPIKDFEWFEKDQKIYWAEPIDTNEFIKALAHEDQLYWDSFGEEEQYEHRVDRRQRREANIDVLKILCGSTEKTETADRGPVDSRQASIWSEGIWWPGKP